MRIDVNPFYARASEYIGSELRFLQLFSPEILKIFDENKIWSSINIIRSAPGGGKTTLLKTFTPEVLQSILDHIEKADNIKEIYKELVRLNVLTKDKNLNIISSLLPISNEYSLLKHLELDDTHKIRIFNSLLNSRVTLSVLRAISEVKGISFPDELHDIQIKNTTKINLPSSVSQINNGHELYKWASSLEEEICTALDSVFPSEVRNISGHEDLFTLKLLDNDNLFIDGVPLTKQILLMFDDVHNLSKIQRDTFFDNILKKRPPINIWVSERTEGLSLTEIFEGQKNFTGHKSKRTYQVIDLESYWRHGKRFDRFCESVADIRIYEASEKDINKFAGCLKESFSKDYDHKEISSALKSVRKRVEEKFSNLNKYKSWIEHKTEIDGNNYEVLLEWRTLEILLYRDFFKSQTTLDFELSKDELEEQEGSDVKHAAAIFLNKEFNIPYYYGFSKLCDIGSNNIEQFLSFAGELYEEVVSKSVVNFEKESYKLRIEPHRQQQIIDQVVKETWEDYEIRIPKFNQIKTFLTSLGKLCKSETYQKNAPISPGVTGFAISMEPDADWSKLGDIVASNKTNSPYYKLAQIIGIGISYNLFEIRPNYKCKGKKWMVLYLNRLLCVKFDLPLNYGGFREKNLSELVSWMNDKYEPKKNLWNQE